ncbi:Steroid C25 dehydrogenase gamma subunit [Sterolibacterium denitrificans]|uniref:Steroid C25 dehydrogenase gamma subunit n=2 Tax=Sterolibacterium denitrificans TaxID=157592 RepID=A0A7Z7MVJ4_9PROT|nr:ethylbenzene dehydrogenase-related protein [Sterolibacterium denitrificans]SMB26753.1 Steroid C25 dehydrogenase gamma subunit [Sterolibacterium denitrificans]SMB27761.1 Steroid C25 dehydrogenase gamma subunit [Sterolibacterium denitrificans]
MKVTYTSAATAEQLLDAEDAVWQQSGLESVSLQGTPWAMQPTAAIRNSWEHKKIGAVGKVELRALHNGEYLAFHLSWADANHNTSHGDNSVWPDAAAVALPLHEDTPLMTMGAPELPMAAWYWRADDKDMGYQVVAQGPGSSQIVDKTVRTRAKWANGRWSVVIARTFKSVDSPNVIQLEPGQRSRFGIAIWEGGQQERGGLKAYSGDWLPLEIAGQ